jgi:hypothetical protein
LITNEQPANEQSARFSSVITNTLLVVGCATVSASQTMLMQTVDKKLSNHFVSSAHTTQVDPLNDTQSQLYFLNTLPIQIGRPNRVVR